MSGMLHDIQVINTGKKRTSRPKYSGCRNCKNKYEKLEAPVVTQSMKQTKFHNQIMYKELNKTNVFRTGLWVSAAVGRSLLGWWAIIFDCRVVSTEGSRRNIRCSYVYMSWRPAERRYARCWYSHVRVLNKQSHLQHGQTQQGSFNTTAICTAKPNRGYQLSNRETMLPVQLQQEKSTSHNWKC